jgi:hypothetical protein
MGTIPLPEKFKNTTAWERTYWSIPAGANVVLKRIRKKNQAPSVRRQGCKGCRRVIVEQVRKRHEGYEPLFGSIGKGFATLLTNYGNQQLETILDFTRRSSKRAREMTAAFSANPSTFLFAPANVNR